MTTGPILPEQPPQEPTAAAPSAPPPTPGPDVDAPWTQPSKGKSVTVRLPIAIAVVVIVALLGVWGGAQLKGNSASASVNAAGTTNGNRFGGEFPGGGGRGQGGAGGGAGFGGTAGTVQSVNGNTITITDASGQTHTITFDASTTITKSDTATAADITPGQNIVVRGSQATDGSTTARAITIGNGLFGQGGPGGRPFGGPPTSQAN